MAGIDSTDDIKNEVEEKIRAEEAGHKKGPAGGWPVCPYCSEDPARVSATPVRLGQFQYVAVYCGNPKCRKIHCLNIVAVEQPRIARGGLVIPS